MTDYSRRQFLGALGAGTVASAGLTQPVAAQETPVVEMGNSTDERSDHRRGRLHGVDPGG